MYMVTYCWHNKSTFGCVPVHIFNHLQGNRDPKPFTQQTSPKPLTLRAGAAGLAWKNRAWTLVASFSATCSNAINVTVVDGRATNIQHLQAQHITIQLKGRKLMKPFLTC